MTRSAAYLRFIALAGVLAAITFMSATPSSTDAGGTFSVTRTDDPAPNGCLPADCSLREAVIAANTNPGDDTITLGPGTHTLSIPGAGENSAATGDLDVNEDATITGAGSGTTTVDAAGLDRAFDIGMGILDLITVSISGITVQSGDAGAEDGGGVRVQNSSGDMLVLNDVELRNNMARRGGGLASGNGSGATLTDVIVRNNTALDSASPMNADGGGIMHCCSDSGTFTLVRGRIHDNFAEGQGGGFFLCCSSSATLEDVAISDNAAGSDGGGLYHCCNSLVMDVTNAVIDNNTSGGDGGGVFNCCAGMSVNFVNATISANQAAGRGGGAFTRDNEGGVLDLLNSTITDNTAGDGAGIFVQPTFGSLAITNTIVALNNGDDCDGAIVSGGNNIDGDGTCGLSPSGFMSGVDPLLGPLADNGGFSHTHALLEGSPAIDNGSNADCPDADQRGVDRPQGPGCDIGAYEREAGDGPTPTPTPASSPTPTPTGGPQGNGIWADDDCNDAVAATDALKKLQDIAAIDYNVEPGCPTLGDAVGVQPAGFGQLIWGDTDCDGDYDAVDALQILRSIAALPPNQMEPCPAIGDPIVIN